MSKWWEFIAFLVLGIFLGFVTGLSGSTIVEAVATGLFSLAGGSAIAYVSKVDLANRNLASQFLLFTVCGALIGLITGILVNQHELLGPKIRLNSLEAVVAHAVEERIEHQREQGEPIPVKDLVALLGVINKSTNNPYLNSDDASAVSTILQQQAAGLIDEKVAFRELKEILQ